MSGWVGDNNHVEPVVVNLMFSLGNPSKDIRVGRGQYSCPAKQVKCGRVHCHDATARSIVPKVLAFAFALFHGALLKKSQWNMELTV